MFDQAEAKTYKIVRMYQKPDQPSRVIKKGLTLAQAREHCHRPDTSSRKATSAQAAKHTQKHGPWFDGYSAE